MSDWEREEEQADLTEQVEEKPKAKPRKRHSRTKKTEVTPKADPEVVDCPRGKSGGGSYRIDKQGRRVLVRPPTKQ